MPIYLDGYKALEHEIPTVVIVSEPLNGIQDIVSSFETSGVGQSEVDLIIELFKSIASNKQLVDTVIESMYAVSTESSHNIINNFMTSMTSHVTNDVFVEAWQSLHRDDNLKIIVDLFLYSLLRKNNISISNSFKINIGTIQFYNDLINDIDLASVRFNSILSDVYCSVLSNHLFIESELNIDMGTVVRLYSDCFSTGMICDTVSTDVFSTVSGTSYPITSDALIISGRVERVYTDIFCSKMNTVGTLKTDVKTHSLFISDFFLNKGKFEDATSIMWIDIIDYLYPVDETKTFLMVDDVVVTNIYFEDIVNGKRLYYDPINDFFSEGQVVYTVHTESTIGEVMEKSFYLLYGYDLSMNENIIWPPAYKVVVRAEAKNNAFCQNLESASFSFETVDYDSFNLPVSINAVSYVDMPVTIHPQSTTFFYGNTYTIKVSGVKDFAGNEMPDFEYTFTIEDPNKK